MVNKDVGTIDNPNNQSVLEKLLRRTINAERMVEFQAANLMAGLEIYHDMCL